MAYLFGRGLLITSILMLGFILGIVYSNHFPIDSENVFQKGPDVDVEAEIESETSFPYKGFTLKETNDLKIDMEDGDQLVIYNHDDEEVRKDLLKDIDVKRDLMAKQDQTNDSGNFISEMGLRTADVFEGVFRSLFALVE